MEHQREATIKGIFLNSHVKALRKLKGDEAVRELERRCGEPLKFKNSEDVPVQKEITLLAGALDILHDGKIPEELREFEAGRLHFRNFCTTPLARIVFSLFRKDLKLIMMHAHHVAGHVFQGIKFTSEELGPSSVRVRADGIAYSPDHFRGLLDEWMKYAGQQGVVEARVLAPRQYEFTLTWQPTEANRTATGHTYAGSSRS